MHKGRQWIRVNFRLPLQSSTNALVHSVTLIVQLRALIDYCWCARYPTDLHLLLERLPILYIHIIIRLLQENCSIYTNHEKENEHFCIQSLDQIYSATKKGSINQTGHDYFCSLEKPCNISKCVIWNLVESECKYLWDPTCLSYQLELWPKA